VTVDLNGSTLPASFDHAHRIDSIGIDFLSDRFDAVTSVPVQDKFTDLTLRAGGAENIAKLFGKLRAFVSRNQLKNVVFLFFFDHECLQFRSASPYFISVFI